MPSAWYRTGPSTVLAQRRFGNTDGVTHSWWLPEGISRPPQLLHAALIQKEAALTRTIPILFPLYFYDCHVDRGKGEVGGGKEERKEK